MFMPKKLEMMTIERMFATTESIEEALASTKKKQKKLNALPLKSFALLDDNLVAEQAEEVTRYLSNKKVFTNLENIELSGQVQEADMCQEFQEVIGIFERNGVKFNFKEYSSNGKD